jgi:enterochelin esterase-like enzyme
VLKKMPVLFLCCWLLFGLYACQANSPKALTPLPSQVDQPTLTGSPLTPSPKPSVTTTATSTNTLPPATLTPALTSTPTASKCLQQGGRIVISQLKVEGLANPLDYRLYLPPCYAEALDQRYPVLYLVHGQSFNDDQWDRLGVDEVLNRWIAGGEIKPFLVVMPRDTNWGTAAQDPFDDALLQGLIPFMDRYYRTLPDREHRAIGGLSRGAGWAANLGLQHPDLFGTVGMHSLAIFKSDVPYIKLWLDAIPPELMPRFYIDAGLNDRPDILNSSRWFEGLLNQRDIPHEWHLFAGYHDETYWKSHLEGYLRWYAAEW